MTSIPNELNASRVVESVTGHKVVSIRRFTTGNHHFVYDVLLTGGRNVVVRLTTPSERESMRGALVWNERLVNLGLPLPKIYYSDIDSPFPFLVMERFPGRDLGFEIGQMSEQQLRSLAKSLMKFQKTVGGLPTAGRFGYAIDPESARAESWMDALTSSIRRSRERIEAVGFVDIGCLKKFEELFSGCQEELRKVKATPFLHDITTKNVIVADGELSGIVDVDSLCYGDPLFQVGLTRMALLSDGSDTRYIDFLLKEFGAYSEDLLRLYTVVCGVGFLSELGQRFNGNTIAATAERKDHLESILRSL
ncbi:MAG: phosphotransferase family protein [Bdellovibrionales bacterium]